MAALTGMESIPLACEQEIRLTQQVKAGGFASKLPPGMLEQVLSWVPQQKSDNLLVGFATHDDAGVYRIRPDLALVQTVDFFTPMVDDPFCFGRIAATNALSDVYAMGGQPLTALALVCFPQDGGLRVLEQVIRGGLDAMREANCVVLGGHSVKDAEIKFGYAVTGTVDPARVLTNSGARPGDVLVLTKAIGTGVITTALKRQCAQREWVAAAVASMTLSNRQGAEIVTETRFRVRGLTDVTGFGLAGHAREMSLGSHVRLRIDTGAIPILDGAREAAERGCIPAGLISNREFAECFILDETAAHIPESLRLLLYDPQTSGGLLISVDRSDAEELVRELRASGYPAAQIGSVLEGSPKIELH
jgi:selenide, water dikinase